MAELAQPISTRESAAAGWIARLGLRGRADLRAWPVLRRFVLVLLALYVAKQGIYVVAFRPFTGHDEVAHFSYLRILAEEGRVPVIPELDEWQAAVAAGRTPPGDREWSELYRYCFYTLDWNRACNDPRWLNNPPYIEQLRGETRPTGWIYTANHPPLYYLLMTPVYWLSQRASPEVQQYWLRLAAIPFGLVTVFLAYRLTRALFPGDAFLAVTVPAFVAFQPQISYEAAMVNNDIVAIALYSWIIYLLVVGVRDRFPTRTCVLVGFALGLGLLAKSTSLTAAPIIALAVFLAVGWRDVRGWVRRGALIVVPAAILAAPWYAFLYRTYGNFDALEQVEELQHWNRPAGTFLNLLTDRDFVVMRFKETWGEFGWRVIHLSPTMLWAIAVPVIVAFGGLVQYGLTANRPDTGTEGDAVMHPVRWQRRALLVLVATCLVAYLAVVEFGTRFELTQARYYFPAVNAGALLLMLGLRTLIPRSVHTYAQGVVFAALVVLNVMIFTQYVIPHYLSG